MRGDVSKGIYREESVLAAVGGRQADLGVDVEETLDAAWRPDSALNTELVRLEVVVVIGALDGEGGGDLSPGCVSQPLVGSMRGGVGERENIPA